MGAAPIQKTKVNAIEQMKSEVKTWKPTGLYPWTAHDEPRDHFRWRGVTLRRYLIPMSKERVPRKMRGQLLETGTVPQVRIRAKDGCAI